MAFLFAQLYDRTMRATEARHLRPWRRELLASARGAVLEIGAGTGANLEHYPRRGLDRLVLAEPDRHMRARLAKRIAKRAAPRPAVELSDAAAVPLPFADGSFDAVVATLVLCTVPDPIATVGEIARVLRPGGRLLLIEHVASDDPRTARWQRRLTPLWRWVAHGCCLSRDTGNALTTAGFDVSGVIEDRMAPGPAIVRRWIRGVATANSSRSHWSA